MKMVNLKNSTETFENGKGEKEVREEYPWGLNISLDNDTIKKLGVSFPDVGKNISLSAIAKIISKSSSEREGEKSIRVELQITDMALDAGQDKSAADVLFDGGE